MEEISFRGEKYVKATVIAKQLGYTSDYVGQLCRGEQVKARLVGRSWYVEEESIKAHKKSRYRSTLAKTKESVQETKKAAEISARTVAGTGPRYMSRIVSYEDDSTDLLPSISKQSSPKASSRLEDKISSISINRVHGYEKYSDVSPSKAPESSRLANEATSIPIRPQVRIISANANTVPSFEQKIAKSRPVLPTRKPVKGRVVTNKGKNGRVANFFIILAAIVLGVLPYTGLFISSGASFFEGDLSQAYELNLNEELQNFDWKKLSI